MSDEEEKSQKTPQDVTTSDAQPDSSDNLEKSEVDNLMASAQQDSNGIVFKSEGGRYEGDVKIEPYDFTSPVLLTDKEMRQVRQKHEKFVQYLEGRLSLSLRMDAALKLSDLYTITYDSLIEKLESPSSIALFNIKQLNGVGLLSMSLRLAMTLINRMLGGHKLSVKEDRPLSEIELGLLDDIVELILKEWCGMWTAYQGLNASIAGRESDPRFLQTASKDTIMLIVEMDIEMEEPEKIQLAFPYFMIEPILENLKKENIQHKATTGIKKAAKWLNSYSNIRVPLYAEWDVQEIPLRDVLNLRPGDVLSMPKDLINATQIRLMNTQCFLGEVGIDGDNVAVMINKKQLKE